MMDLYHKITYFLQENSHFFVMMELFHYIDKAAHSSSHKIIFIFMEATLTKHRISLQLSMPTTPKQENGAKKIVKRD